MTQSDRDALDNIGHLLREVERAWRAASTGALHGPGCGCCANWSVAIGSALLGEDLEFALRKRYRTAGRWDLVDLLDERADAGFLERLRHIVSIQAPGSRQILTDVLQTLDSVTGRTRPSRWTATSAE